MDRLREFSDWAVELTYRDIPSDVLRKARLQVMNMIGAMIAGYRTETDSPEYDGEGSCRTFDAGALDAPTAFVEYATNSMRHDFDDYLFMAHSGHSAVLAPLAVGQLVNASGREFLKAVVVANELEGRLGASTVLGPHNGQMWSFIHTTGAAAATALLKGADAEEFHHALLLSLYNPNYPNTAGFMGGDSKNLTASLPGSTGVRLADRALAGDRGHEDIFEHENGFLSTYAYVPLPEMVAGFGDSWVTRTVAFKPVPGCAYLQAPVQAYRSLRDDHNFTGSDVESVQVDASLLTMLMESHSSRFWGEGQLTPVNVTFSVVLSLGLLLSENDFGVSYLEEQFLANNSDRIREAAERVNLRHRWDRTIKVIDGVNAGIDVGPLVEQRGLWTVIKGFRKMRREHQGLSTTAELVNLMTSGRLMDVWNLFDSPLDWDEFKLGEARMDSFAFNFGADVTVTLKSGREVSQSLPGHRGRSDEGAGEQKPIVEGKLWEQADAYFRSSSRAENLVASLQDLPDSSVRDVAEVLFGSERGSRH